MDNLTIRTGVVAHGASLPLKKLRTKPRWRGVLEAILEEVQELETAIVESIEKRYLANAIGWALEQNGKLVGRPKPGLGQPGGGTDYDTYRALIYAQIAANKSTGTWTDIYGIMGMLGCSGVLGRELHPATFMIEYSGTPFVSGAQLRDVLETATPPFAIDLIYYESAADAFAFAGIGPGKGFGYGEFSTAF